MDHKSQDYVPLWISPADEQEKKKKKGTTKCRADDSNYLTTSPWSITTKQSLWPFYTHENVLRSKDAGLGVVVNTFLPTRQQDFKESFPSKWHFPFITLEHLVQQQRPVREHSAICSTHISFAAKLHL